MKNRLYLIILFMLFVQWVNAQDTLTIMQYNLLYYGNYSTGNCNETNNSTQEKDESIRTILNYVKPDIFTVCEFGASQSLHTSFLRNNLNVNGKTYWQTDNIINYAGSNIINHIFYDSRKMGLKKHVALRTNPRDTDVYELYLKTPALASGDTIKLICIVAHPKAGESYESSRRAQMQKAMDHVKQYYAKDNVLIMGDFNMYGANETGYRLLTQTYSTPDVLFKDPLYDVGGVGEWHGSSQYTRYHTQSTHKTTSGCFVDGGLDDRFDFILMSYEIAYSYDHLRYVPDSYKAVGNDGRHYNQSVNQGSNTAVPTAVANALYNCSDHLPVTMKIAVDAHLGVEEELAQCFQASVAPNPAMNSTHVHFFCPSQGYVQFDLYSLQGQLLQRESALFDDGVQQFELSLEVLPKGFYLLRMAHESGLNQTVKILKN